MDEDIPFRRHKRKGGCIYDFLSAMGPSIAGMTNG